MTDPSATVPSVFTCSIQGCSGVVRARGWCQKHYARWRRHGSPDLTALERLGHAAPLAERITQKIALRSGTPAWALWWSCWEWQGRLKEDGYAVLQVDGKLSRVHRVTYELVAGPVPAGLPLDHLCRNRRCCNPMHLEAVTGRENTLRGEGPSAANARKTSCLRGHPFDDENTYVTPSTGARQCRACAADRFHKETR